MQSHGKEVIKTVVRAGQKKNAHFMYKCVTEDKKITCSDSEE